MKTDRESSLVDLPGWKAALEQIAGPLNATVQHVAFATGIGDRDLEKQLLLHLPRFSLAELAEPGRIRAEAERLAERALRLRAPFAHWADQARIPTFQKAAVQAAPCSDDLARVIHERFHYLGSFRAGHHLALFAAKTGGVPMALVTLSPMDISHLRPLYPTARDLSKVRVVSRLFAFDWAPRNSVSYLLGQASKWIRDRWPEVGTLLTYVNPNLGFTGASYEASNWSEFVEVPARYAYLDGNYITFRNLMSLPAGRRQAACYSQYQLAPLKIFRYQIRPRPGLHRETSKPETTHVLAEAR
jgi:hypothetical protein